jgi:hypothetical protein
LQHAAIGAACHGEEVADRCPSNYRPRLHQGYLTMQKSLLTLSTALLVAGTTIAQSSTILFTGRFPFVGVDAVNERPNGAMNRLEEFDFSYAVPGPITVARSLLPATAMQCYLGDGNGDGRYTKFFGFKTYFENIQIGGIFVKAADRANVTWSKVFFTVRDNVTTPGSDIEVLTNNGTVPLVLQPGDWVRLLPNGNVETFLTVAQLQVAAGPSPGASVHGAHALLQASNGDLYYVPVQGGHWVNGSLGAAAFAQDGAICKIDGANITYDAAGNVASLAPNSARLLINEAAGGPGGALTVRGMTIGSGAVDRFGAPLIATSYGKTAGLAFDPAGGTFTSIWPDSLGNYTNEPNLLFCSDGGSYGGTIWSTANSGSVAVINGVLCGSTTSGVPATGSWLGVQLDTVNFQPSLMGFTLADQVTSNLLIDQNEFGSLPLAASQPTWDVDMQAAPFTPVFLLVSPGSNTPGAFLPSLPGAVLGGLLTAGSWPDVFLQNPLLTLGLAVTDAFGYGTVSVPNPNTGGFTNLNLLVQGVGLGGAQLELSSPMCVQLR